MSSIKLAATGRQVNLQRAPLLVMEAELREFRTNLPCLPPDPANPSGDRPALSGSPCEFEKSRIFLFRGRDNNQEAKHGNIKFRISIRRSQGRTSRFVIRYSIFCGSKRSVAHGTAFIFCRIQSNPLEGPGRRKGFGSVGGCLLNGTVFPGA